MPRRLPLLLRAWSGVLLACALFACLTGLARPAMTMAMPGPMGTPHVAVRGHSEASAVVAAPDHGPRCPVAQEQCVAPKGVRTQDGPTAPAPRVTCDGLFPRIPAPVAPCPASGGGPS